MNYAWNLFLFAKDNGINTDHIHFIPEKTSNPYREVGFQDINKADITDESIEINGYYRYNEIFAPLLEDGLSEYPELQEVIFDVFMHYLSELDLRQGMSRAEYHAKFIWDDIQNGVYGDKYRGIHELFTPVQRRQVKSALLKTYVLGPSMYVFTFLLRALYNHSISYLDTWKKRELLLYIGMSQTLELKKQIEFLCEFFVPLDYDIKLFWDMHFGIIGVDETMIIDNIMMYE